MNLNIKLNNISEIKQAEQFPLREDVIQFSYDIAKSARNKFRKRNHVGSNHDISTQLPSQNRSSIKYKRSINEAKQQGSYTDRQIRGQANINQLFKQNDVNKRTSLTSKNTYRERSLSSTNNHKISKTQSMQIQNMLNYTPVFEHSKPYTPFTTDRVTEVNQNKNQQQVELLLTFNQSGGQNKFDSLEKKHNKSKLKDSTIPSWLNQVLMESSTNTNIKKEENAGLKQFSIDRSSLLRKGIHVQHINRLYQSLYVYSVGFNDLLKEICNRNSDLQKSIWKVYAILLQFCSGGDFQTMIGQIQRDKQLKLLQFRNQIEKRQKIIEQHDETHEKKNMKMLKQVRQLQQKTKDLQEQKQIIMQQFRQAEQSFNQEISLRLKYETKINFIHGTYEQVKQKYTTLKEEYQKNLRIIRENQEDKIKLNKKITDLQINVNELNLNIEVLEKQNALLQQNYKQQQKSSKAQGMNYITMKTQAEGYVNIIAEKKRKIDQLELKTKNLEASQRALMETYQNKNDEFQKAMRQNSKLNQQIQKQFETISQLTQEKRELGLKTTEIAALLGIQTRKTVQKQQQLRSTRLTLNNVQEQLTLKQVDLSVQKAKSNSLANDLEQCYQNIKQMKEKQGQLTNMITQLQRKLSMLSEVLVVKKNQEQKMIHQIEELKKDINNLKIEIKLKQSKINISQEKYKSQSEVWTKRLEQMTKQKQNMALKCQKAQKERQDMFEEMIRAKEQYEQLYIDLKNEKFQRNNLDLYYKQSLSVVEEEIDHIKKLDIKISQLKQSLQQSNRKYNTLQLIHKHKTQLFEKDVAFWKESSFNMQKRAKQKKYFIHPMILEDYAERNRILQENKAKLMDHINKKEKKIKQLSTQRDKIVQQCKFIEKRTTEGTQKLYKNQLGKRDKQISFLKEKVQYQSTKLKQADQEVSKAKNEKNSAIQSLRREQTEFMNKLNEKSLQLKELNNKYRSVISLNENQLQENSKSSVKYQKQRNELRTIVEQLSLKVKNYEMMMQKQRKKERIDQKKNNIENRKEADISEQTSKQKIKRYKQNGTFQDEQQLQNLSSKQQLKKDRKPKTSQKTIQVIAKQTKQEDPLKRRQDMRKKIKGAYLYYKK